MLTAVLLALALEAAVPGACSPDLYSAGLCGYVANSGASIDIGAIYDEAPTTNQATRAGGGYVPQEEDEYGVADTSQDDTFRVRCDADADDCGPLAPTAPEETDDAAEIPAVTMSDLVSFAPAPLAITAEPGGVGIVGMPVNFVVPARTHELTGVLFDFPVAVRFTPASVVFDYGDGTTRETSDGGATWASTGAPQFTATPTSHAYGATGVYTTRVTVVYTAEATFGGAWIPVPGTLDIPAGAASVEIFELRTALVAETCTENPTGPGC